MSERISIVTICFNNPEELQHTCAQIDAQTLLPYEHWIIDGSKDGRIRQWLESADLPVWRKWISEPDRGISDAFNKGILRCTGDIIHLQNSGDYYYDSEVLAEVTRAFQSNPKATWLHGQYAQFRGGIWVISGKPYERAKLYRGMRTIGHPTMFVRKELYDRYGLFDLEKKIAMDYDFLVRIADEPFIFLPRPLVVFTPGGVSNKLIRAGLKEVAESYIKYQGADIRLQLWGWRIRLLQGLTDTYLGRMLFKLKNKSGKLKEDSVKS